LPVTLARAQRHVADETARLAHSQQRANWPRFLYHTCDVKTAIEIIRDDALKCRNNAQNFVDVANQGALQIFEGSHGCARLYFRPKNGFHFRTEGIKCLQDPHRLPSHMSIPVMFLFDFTSVATLPGSRFSDGNVQKSKIFLSGDEEFNKLDFSAVYHDSWTTAENREYIHNKRMSEISVEGDLPLCDHLKAIVFRTASDLQTFNYMLALNGIACGHKTMVERIRGSLFLSRGLFLNDISSAEKQLSLTFNFPTDFTPPDRIFRVYAEKRIGVSSHIYDKGIQLTQPTLEISGYPSEQGVWTVRLEDQLAFIGNINDIKSELLQL
jgi:hypothetical protein